MILYIFGVLLWLSEISFIAKAQDYAVYGVFAQSTDYPLKPSSINRAYGRPFQGVGLTTCTPNLPDDDIVLSYDRPYYLNLASNQGQFYSLECCGNPPNYIDTWDLSCQNSIGTQAIINQYYNMELRMARRKTLTDTELVICPFPRKVCTYSPGLNLCDRSQPYPYLHGYTVTLTVNQYDSNLAFWRGVSKCDIVQDERDYPLASNGTFRETIVLKHVPIDTFSANDPIKMIVIIVGLSVGLYIVLYFLRRKRCEYCQGKLVFSRRMCYKCVLVGAQPPDPVLLKALEDRGLHMQGKPPERFGCPQTCCVGCFRCLYQCFTCHCCCRCCCRCCRFMCCCGCFGLCCQDKPDEDKIFATDDDDMLTEDQGDVERGDSQVELISGNKSHSLKDESGSSLSNKKSKSQRAAERQARLDAEQKEMELIQKKKQKNPNIVEYPKKTIYKAIKHPAVPIV